ncbi:MAG: outer membrane protein assembly factor BamC [Gallionella sp.]
MKVIQIGFLCSALIALAGCSALGSDGKRIDYGADAKQLPSLEVPPDLTVPGSDDRFRIPQSDGSSSATYSDYRKAGSQKQIGAVLPELQWVHLEREGAQRWLVVRDNPDNVWPVVKAFFQELGLTIRSEEPAAGVMETEWAKNRALPSSSKAKINPISQAFDDARNAEIRDRYIARLERSQDGASTSIYITHNGIEEVISLNGRTIKWKARPEEPEFAAIMLQRLMMRLGAGELQAALALKKANEAPVATPTNIPDTNIEPLGTASLRKLSDGTVIILMNDQFDRSWRKVGLAIENSALAVEDLNRAKGIYYLKPIKLEQGWLDGLKFWKSDEDTEQQYRVNVKDGGATSKVTVTDQNGSSNTASKQMLEALYEHITPQ